MPLPFIVSPKSVSRPLRDSSRQAVSCVKRNRMSTARDVQNYLQFLTKQKQTLWAWPEGPNSSSGSCDHCLAPWSLIGIFHKIPKWQGHARGAAPGRLRARNHTDELCSLFSDARDRQWSVEPTRTLATEKPKVPSWKQCVCAIMLTEEKKQLRNTV